MRTRRERKGATIVVIALLITVLVSMMAVSIDLSRMYVGRAELQTAADATAHMGAVQLARGWAAGGRMTAFAPDNSALGAPVSAGSTFVQTGYWVPATHTFSVAPPPSPPPGPNAARAITRRQTRWAFGGAIGLGLTPVISDTAIAWVGSLATGTCVKPWSFPFDLLTRLVPGSPDPSSYQFSQADLNALAALPALPPTPGASSPASRSIISPPPSNASGPAPRAPPAPFSANWDGVLIPGAGYQTALIDAQCQFPVSTNSVLDTPGSGVDASTSAVISPSICRFASASDVCFQSDGVTPGVKVRVAFGLPSPGGQVLVRMLGEFTVTCYARAPSGGGSGGQGLVGCPAQYMPVPVPSAAAPYGEGTIVGYFTPDFNLTLSDGDGLGATPSIAQKVILVR